jgi:hypothetical protein
MSKCDQKGLKILRKPLLDEVYFEQEELMREKSPGIWRVIHLVDLLFAFQPR